MDKPIAPKKTAPTEHFLKSQIFTGLVSDKKNQTTIPGQRSLVEETKFLKLAGFFPNNR